MPSIFFRARAVKRVLADLNVNKSSGPDGIPALVLKQCSSTLARPLAKLFCLSYRAGIFPSCWKLANVTPIPKKGEANNPENYRPIAVCSALSKVMESMINHHLVRYLESNGLLNDRQYGFRKGRSTGDLLALLSERWNGSIHRFGEAKVVALDISKAFDRVWHEALVSKLIAFGVGSHFSRFISSFLKDRTIRVVIDGVFSDEFRINSGVPQGSVLSPTLFLIFLNDLLSITSNPIYSFADDSNICHSYSFDRRPSLLEIGARRSNMNDALTSDLITISEWGRANRVDFNARKTQCCFLTHRRDAGAGVLSSVSMGNVNIEEADALDVLGMRISCDARWNDHIFRVSKEAFKCLGFLKRCRKYFTPSDLLTIYRTFIRPRMEYNSHVWAGASKSILKLLDRVQERVKVLINDSRVSNSIDSLEHRRNVACVSLFYRYYNGRCSREIRGLVPDNHIFLRGTRTSRRAHPFVVDCPVNRTMHYRENSFFARTARLWNDLPAEVFPVSYDIGKFKSNVHKHYSLFPPSYNLFS